MCEVVKMLAKDAEHLYVAYQTWLIFVATSPPTIPKCGCNSKVYKTVNLGPDLQKILGKILSLSYVFPKFILSSS